MQRLGLALHVTPSRNIIAKAENLPRIGETVVDENLKLIGKVFDIIGPVSAPYIAIRPSVKEPERLVSKRLYTVPSKGERRRSRNE